MSNLFIEALVAIKREEYNRDDSTVGVDAVPADESLLCDKLIEDRAWRPYCLKCDTMSRMSRMPYGFQCVKCQNTIKWDMTHYYGEETEQVEESEQVKPESKKRNRVGLPGLMASALVGGVPVSRPIDCNYNHEPRKPKPKQRKVWYTVDSPEVKAMSDRRK